MNSSLFIPRMMTSRASQINCRPSITWIRRLTLWWKVWSSNLSFEVATESMCKKCCLTTR